MSPADDRLIAWHRELQAAHTRLRAALELAQDAPSSDVLLYCLGFCTALGGHHRSEDGRLFPELIDRHPELATTIARLEQDHAMIAHLLGAFEAAIRSQAPPDEIARHLEGVAAIMESHFRYEERQLSGILAELDLDAPVGDVLGPL